MSNQPIQLHRYEPDPLDESLVLEALRSGRLSHGRFAAELETRMAAACGCTDGAAVSSPGLAMGLLCRALDLRAGDEVVVSPFVPPTMAEAIVAAGGRLVLADVEPSSLNLDPAKVEAAITPRTRLIVFSYTLGNPLQADRVERVGQRHEIPVIEDVTEGLATRYRERPAGSFGRAAIVALGADSIVACGGGAVVVTDDARLAVELRGLRAGRAPAHPAAVVAAVDGLNELTASLAIGQLRRLTTIRARRTALAEAYVRRLMDVPQLIIPTIDPQAEMAWSGFACRLDTTFTSHERDSVVRAMRLHDIEAAAPGVCLHQRDRSGELLGDGERLPIAESISQRLIRLPLHEGMTPRDVDVVGQTLEVMLDRENLRRG